MAIKSLEDLMKIREESLKRVQLREAGEAEGDIVELLVVWLLAVSLRVPETL